MDRTKSRRDIFMLMAMYFMMQMALTPQFGYLSLIFNTIIIHKADSCISFFLVLERGNDDGFLLFRLLVLLALWAGVCLVAVGRGDVLEVQVGLVYEFHLYAAGTTSVAVGGCVQPYVVACTFHAQAAVGQVAVVAGAERTFFVFL